MTLARILDSLDGVDESLKGLYTEGDDGKFRLDVDDNAPLAKALESKKARVAQLQADLDALRSKFADVDLDEVGKMRGELTKLREAKEAGVDNDKLEEMVSKRVESVRKQLEERVKTLEAENQKLSAEVESSKETTRVNSIKGALRKSLTAAGVQADALEDAVVLAMGDFNAVDDEGVPIALGEAGEPKISTRKGGNYSVTEWLESRTWLKPAKSGSGAPGAPGNNGSPVAAGKKRSEMTNKERSAFISQHGGDAYNNLPA